jgi:hypothetical protein
MTPQEKAEELVHRFMLLVRWKMGQEDVLRRAKECALIAVNEILNETSSKHFIIGRNGLSGSEYWNEVKKQIEKL